MPALLATSLRLIAACSRVKARITARPLASPPIASRRRVVLLARIARGVYFDIRKSGRPGRDALTAPRTMAQSMSRIPTRYSLYENRSRQRGRLEDRPAGPAQ